MWQFIAWCLAPNSSPRSDMVVVDEGGGSSEGDDSVQSRASWSVQSVALDTSLFATSV